MQTFPHCEIMGQLYRGAHAVDESNKLRQDHSSIEAAWKTHRWWIRSFSFILALCDTNGYSLWTRKLQRTDFPHIRHWRAELANQLLCRNRRFPTPQSIGAQHQQHIFMVVPDHHKFDRKTGTFVKYEGRKRRQQRMCSVKKAQTCFRSTTSYCSCNPAAAMCRSCHSIHAEEAHAEDIQFVSKRAAVPAVTLHPLL